MTRKSLSLIVVMMLTSMSVFAQKTPNISVFADHIYEVAKQDTLSFEDAAKKVYALGVRGVDVYVTMNPQDLMILNKVGFRPASAILVADLVNNDCQEDIAKAFGFMHQNNYKRLLLVPGLMPDKPTQEMYGRLYQRIERFAQQAKAQGIDVTVEDYDNDHSPCYNTACLNQMFAACPSLGLTFDTGNFCICNENVMEARQHFNTKIKHVHLKDRKAMGQWDVVAVGTGVVPTRVFVSSLLSEGYDGWFTIECFGAGNMLDAIKTGATTLSSIKLPEQPNK